MAFFHENLINFPTFCMQPYIPVNSGGPNKETRPGISSIMLNWYGGGGVAVNFGSDDPPEKRE
jgi:hypothetical protein